MKGSGEGVEQEKSSDSGNALPMCGKAYCRCRCYFRPAKAGHLDFKTCIVVYRKGLLSCEIHIHNSVGIRHGDVIVAVDVSQINIEARHA